MNIVCTCIFIQIITHMYNAVRFFQDNIRRDDPRENER